MDDVYDIETLAEEIKATERKLSDLRQEYRERKTAGLRAALEARKEAEKMIREEMKGLDHRDCYITFKSVGSLA
jgi:predicted CopG family antitoxin